MKYATAAIVSLAALVSAQGISDIPSCALPCLLESVKANTKCEVSDIPCVCKSIDKVQGPATGCVLKACGEDVAINKVLPAAKGLCAGGSTPSSAPASSAPASSAPASSAPASSAPASSAPASSAPASSAPASSAPASTGYPAPVTSASYAKPSQPATSTECETSAIPSPVVPPYPSGNTTAPKVPVITGGAAAMAPAGSLALLAIGALML
ncbi:hypothetical protein CDD82_5689 [Ophiocordyceps australis]|uniref:CFEM domain-containing protein n=1 Tax=Ophiocordyceps australis TaxID=1399860 RepID=A0A2C5Y4L3_9HYPO|nr:hypothetical protein CDD82_5689 [Ophiocordyceps australis]